MGTSWLVVIVALSFFAGLMIPFQRAALVRSMELQSMNLATSIAEVTLSALAIDDYATVVDHCSKVVDERPSIKYIVITRMDGSSNIFTEKSWRFKTLSGIWTPSASELMHGSFLDSSIVASKVFHYSYPMAYSGVELGWIHVGLALNNFDAENNSIYFRTIFIAVVAMLFGFFASIVFARKITRPIRTLSEISNEIARGNLAVRAKVKTGDEIEELAKSFNQMTESLENSQSQLQQAHDELEERVLERTSELSHANVSLTNEIEERARAEEKIRQSLHEKEILLKEIHHRVKNNLQVISSLLYLQSLKIEDNKSLELFVESQNRVKSMALIHEKLYQSSDLLSINLSEYLQGLATELMHTYNTDPNRLKLEIDVGKVNLDLNSAVPMGLIVNELVTNSLKYAFPAGSDISQGILNIQLIKTEAGNIQLTVADNGIGLPDDFDIQQSGGLGMELVNSLTSQIDGKIEIENTCGVKFTITI